MLAAPLARFDYDRRRSEWDRLLSGSTLSTKRVSGLYLCAASRTEHCSR
jgi:hypothetical protein